VSHHTQNRVSFNTFFFFSGSTVFELRASHLLGRHSTTWATLPVLFAQVIFQIGTYVFLPRLALNCNSPQVAGIIGVSHHTWSLFNTFYNLELATATCYHFCEYWDYRYAPPHPALELENFNNASWLEAIHQTSSKQYTSLEMGLTRYAVCLNKICQVSH
jgi:hypothetical protein